jgi:FKBP-type peptidyl-prolyl cis-trans isomerase (trigger factor)
MEYKLKHVSSTRKEILLALEKKLIEELVLKKVVKLRNNINMPGFRKGRIPVHIKKKKIRKFNKKRNN